MTNDEMRRRILEIADMLGERAKAEEAIRMIDEDAALSDSIVELVHHICGDAHNPAKIRGRVLPLVIWILAQHGMEESEEEFTQGVCFGLSTLENTVGPDVYETWYLLMKGLFGHMELHEESEEDEHSGFPGISEN